MNRVSRCVLGVYETSEKSHVRSDRANISTSLGGGIQSPDPRVIGNVVVVVHHGKQVCAATAKGK
jgi:hypothetical protein